MLKSLRTGKENAKYVIVLPVGRVFKRTPK
jgi:hypothetical protein